MIIFMNGRHTFVEADDAEPIVWVDSSDATTYTLSGNDVLTLDNKGTLGGAMTLNGSVKFANSGFESWTVSDYITRDLGEPFLSNNSFTIVTTFYESLTNTSTRYWSELSDGANNERLGAVNVSSNDEYNYAKTPTEYQNIVPIGSVGVRTHVQSYDINSLELIQLNHEGTNITHNSVDFDSLNNSKIFLLKSLLGLNTKANNPLHEFRLYNRAMSLTQMQNLQTELNNKYTP